MSVQLLDKTRKINKLLHNNNSVSYTHLDVYKRQLLIGIGSFPFTLLLFGVNILVLFVTFFSARAMITALAFWFMTGFSFLAFVTSYIYRKIFSKYERVEEPEAETEEA